MLFSASIYNLYFFNLAAVMADPMFATCCESIIGCRTCVELWLVTSDHCLKCRAGDFENKIHESLFDHKGVFDLTLLISLKTNVFHFQMV
jgi:hypothetical protein